MRNYKHWILQLVNNASHSNITAYCALQLPSSLCPACRALQLSQPEHCT